MKGTNPNQGRGCIMTSPYSKYCSQLWPTVLKRDSDKQDHV